MAGRVEDHPGMQAGKAPGTAPRVAWNEQRTLHLGRMVRDVFGRRQRLIVPEGVEECGGGTDELARCEADMRIALAHFSGKRARVEPANVEAAEESGALVYHQQLAVVAPSVFQRMAPAEGVVPAERDAGLLQLVLQAAECRKTGAELIKVQPHRHPSPRPRGQRRDKTFADLVGSEDEGLHAYLLLGAVDRADHGGV